MLALAAIAAAALAGSASAFPLSQAAIKRGMGAPHKTKPLKTAAPLCCANNQDGSYVLLNSTSFVNIDVATNTATHPSIVNLATQYSRLGARLIQFYDETHSALSPSGNYIIEQPDGNYMFYAWNSTGCEVTGPASFPLPVMCFGDGYVWSTPVDTAHFLIGHRNLTVINSEINQGNLYIDNEFCAPVGMDTQQGVGTFFNSFVGILPDAWWALPTSCNAAIEKVKAMGYTHY